MRKEAVGNRSHVTKMRERRKCKSRHTEEGKAKYRQLNNELRREMKKARAKWWERECEEMEELDRSGRSDMVYAKVKQLMRKSSIARRNTSIKDRDGKLITELDKISLRGGNSTSSSYMTRRGNQRRKASQ
jgi:hypothetical protein